MSAPIDFYFDFSSPYGYFASEKIDALAARYGREVNWRPILLGPAFKATGSAPLAGVPLKGEYSLHDFQRTARYLDVPFRQPSTFPIATHYAARAFMWLEGRDSGLARAFAHAAYRAFFADDVDISGADVVLDIAEAQGADRIALAEAIVSDAMKLRLRNAVEEAIGRGVFGSPYIVIDGEPFWGVDRLPQIEKWLAEGGF
ncbi:MAG: 2-hydroxychromene-2-carboxylate isomerase [Zoogloea sp.]|nr:2-hydroxychromene-2-carboxylate isomerase [Zoogloea sp.]